ncbi:MAG: 50S ribosome-binding GTPase, partial [Candidatus Shikimatogenerans sp. JK-2022]|nr:50S ribosome-binding GTPase [Candidatus Shikimatogenerans bostrichidophilus]
MNNIDLGIIGLPNVGKSSFFKLLTNNNNNYYKKKIINNYPFSTIKPNISNINIYDYRLIKLSKILNFKNYIFNKIKLIDIAGIIKNSYKGKGLGNLFLSYISNTKILINVLRLFYDNKIININKNIIDPIYESNIINNELLMKDIIILKKYINKNKKKNINIYKKILLILEKKNLKKIKKICYENYKKIKKFNFLSLKPIINICNINKYTNKDEILIIKEYFKKKKKKIFFLNIKKLIKKKNINNTINKIINIVYKKLNLNTFFTLDKKKNTICSWKIKKKT